MTDEKKDINFLPKDIIEGEIKKGVGGKPYKEKNKNDNKKVSKMKEKPEKKSKWC